MTEKRLTTYERHFRHRHRHVDHALLSKLFLVDGQQICDPVVQPHTEDELSKRKQK